VAVSSKVEHQAYKLAHWKSSVTNATRLPLQVEPASYKEIALCLGVDNPGQVIFATDSIKEAEAATKAGWSVGLTVRPGNPPLPADAASRFRVIETIQSLLEDWILLQFWYCDWQWFLFVDWILNGP